MTVDELKTWIERGEPLVVLDVRENEERAYCAIPLPPAIVNLHVPMAEIPARLEALRAAAQDAPLVIYCHLGMRSMNAAHWLASRGVTNVHNLDGGIDAWSGIDPTVLRY
jgi:rhodanese-related sulfurtransferase